MKGRIALVFILLLSFIAVAAAAKTPAPKDITFFSAMRIGDVLLPAGSYKVSHVEEAGQHIMIFKKTDKTATEYRVKCTLQPVTEKIARTEQYYKVGNGGEHILTELVFAGDTVRHIFR